jgi:hypothetical protein
MTTFTLELAHNPYLARGAERVDVVVGITASGTSAGGDAPLAIAILVDCSGSMAGPKVDAARAAVVAAVQLLPASAWFTVIAGSEKAQVVFPLSPATTVNKRAAAAVVQHLKAGGGTCMSTWLAAAAEQLGRRPDSVRHALLLTDGNNEGEPDDRLSLAVEACRGTLQCDARGVGTDWRPDQLRLITGPLLGTVDIIPAPADIADDFRQVIATAAARGVAEATLRVWTPATATVEFCRLVHPQHADLTGLCRVDPATPQVRDYPTGAWGQERRDYHLALRVRAGAVDQRVLAARVAVVVGGNKAAESNVIAAWTDDEGKAAVIDPAVAHYTGQSELADSVRQGLAARAAGDATKATALLGRAVQLAAATNPDTLRLLRTVVAVDDEKQGTVRLLRTVRKEDEFALDTRSVRTTRVARPAT